MKLITLSIDHRVSHVVDFDHSSDMPADTYIITKGNDTPLLAFYHDDAQVPLSGGDRDDEFPQPSSGARLRACQANGTDIASIVLQTSQAQSVAFIKSIGCKKNDDGSMELHIMLTTESTPLQPIQPPVSFSHQEQGDLWEIALCDLPDEASMINVTLTLCEPDCEPVDRVLQLCVAPPADIADVVLDFGSEASQMALFDQHPMDIDGIQPIFSDMKELLADANTDERFVQQDTRDPNLFKSLFYVRTQVDAAATPVPTFIPATFRIQDDPNLSMMTTESEVQRLLQDHEYIQMPNVKVSGFGGVREPRVGGKPVSKFRDGFFYRATINRFILNAFVRATADVVGHASERAVPPLVGPASERANAEGPASERAIGRQCCVRLNVLMPNVYTHSDVQNRLKWLKEDIAVMLSASSHTVRCCEIIVISESDASFLGALDLLTHPDSPRPLAPGRYLVMDAGKGTLDFSIVEYRNGEVMSCFRSGIIGAGNAMSYAYMLGLLSDFLTERTMARLVRDEDLQEWVFTKILLQDPASDAVARLRTSRLTEAIDRYKIAVGEGQADYTLVTAAGQAAQRATAFSQLDLEAFLSYVEQTMQGTRFKPLSKGAQKYVDAMARRIAADAARSLSIARTQEFTKEENGLKGVFFAGRAFRDKPLKIAIFNRLKADGIVQQELEYLDEDHYAFNQKNICLYIRSHLQRGVTSTRMLSTPYARVRRQQQDAEEKHSDGGGILGAIGRGWSRLTRHAPEVINTLSDAFTGYDTDDDTFQYNYVAAMAPVNGMVYGYDLIINDIQQDWILIGGTYYRPTGSGHLKLFYSDDRIYVRSEDAPLDAHSSSATKELLPDDTANMYFPSLIFATLFPYIDTHTGEMSKVFIPKADTLPASSPATTAPQPSAQPVATGIRLGDPRTT